MSDPRPPHFSMFRAYTMADLFTLGNAACGVSAIFCCLDYLNIDRVEVLWVAFALLPLALFFDFMDGRVARWRHTHSPMGAELDSLSDVVSFGVAPAVLGFTLGLRGYPDIACLIFCVTCAISRLARYNIMAPGLSDEKGKVRYFVGVPVTVTLLLVLMWGVLLGIGRVGDNMLLGVFTIGPFHLHPLSLLYVLAGGAMISGTIRIPKP